MEKLLTERKIEDYSETIQNFEELSKLKKEMYSSENCKENYDLIYNWYNLVKIFEPRCTKSRLHHFLLGSSLPEENYRENKKTSERINDLEGDFSAENFICASMEERANIINRLKHLNKEDGVKNKAA